MAAKPVVEEVYRVHPDQLPPAIRRDWEACKYVARVHEVAVRFCANCNLGYGDHAVHGKCLFEPTYCRLYSYNEIIDKFRSGEWGTYFG